MKSEMDGHEPRGHEQNELESMGEVGIEMFDGRVVSEEALVALMVAALESRDVLRR